MDFYRKIPTMNIKDSIIPLSGLVLLGAVGYIGHTLAKHDLVLNQLAHYGNGKTELQEAFEYAIAQGDYEKVAKVCKNEHNAALLKMNRIDCDKIKASHKPTVKTPAAG